MSPEGQSTLLYGVSTLVGIVGVLIAAGWNMTRAEAKATALALSAKASSEALKDTEARSIHALSEQRAGFQRALDDQKSGFHDRLREVGLKQDREIDWLKKEVDGINDTLADMRKESQHTLAEMRREAHDANQNMMSIIQDLTLLVQSTKPRSHT